MLDRRGLRRRIVGKLIVLVEGKLRRRNAAKERGIVRVLSLYRLEVSDHNIHVNYYLIEGNFVALILFIGLLKGQEELVRILEKLLVGKYKLQIV